MQLSAVLLARVLLFIESNDLNPRGAAFYPDIIRGLAQRYNFQKYPQKFEDLDESKGVDFELGKIDGHTIQKVTIYSYGIALETTSSTRDSETLLQDALQWASKTLGLNYQPEMVKRKVYTSQVTFYSKVPLLFIDPILQDIRVTVSKLVSENLKLECIYEPSGILLSMDPETQRIPAPAFTVERRVATAFSENKYFSSAPLPTEVHLALLEQYEKHMTAHVTVTPR